MGRKLEDLTREAMELTAEARAALAKRLLDSLESVGPTEHQQLWVEESARRYDELREGSARSIPSEEVFAKLSNRE